MSSQITTNGSINNTKPIEPFKLYPFGIMVNAIDMSQKGFYLVKSLNDIVDNDYHFSPTVFYNEYSKSIDVNRFCALLDKEAWGYDGPVIATNLETANTLINCPCPKKKFFYVWDLEWLYNTFPYQYLQQLYQGDLELIARNERHSDIITKYWKKPIYIMDNFDTKILKKIAQEGEGI